MMTNKHGWTSSVNKNRPDWSGHLLVVSLVLICFGCEQQTATQTVKTDLLDSSITELHNLGWLGASAHPLSEVVKVTDPDNADKTVSPGGIVVAEVEDGPLADAGISKGDAILRVADDWMPIKEDSTPDFIELIEAQISGQKDSISLGFLRNGKYNTVELPVERPSIDDGLPLVTERGVESSTKILHHLATLQQEDGAFDTNSKEAAARLVATAMAGLAFLSADESESDQFETNIAKCIEFVSKKLDSDLENLNPLTAAYVAMFLAETDVQLMDESWLDKIGKLTTVFANRQHESGGWNVTSVEPDNQVESSADLDDKSSADSTDNAIAEETTDSDNETTDEEVVEVDVYGTFSTNQVLLAIGALERKGMSGENTIVEKGCGYLQAQAKLRIPSSIDRRTKAALSAGTAAALVALNCDRGDLTLKEHLKTALSRAHDIYFSPALGLPGLWHAAIASRQMGNERWIQFHNAFKHQAILLHRTDGSFAPYPNVDRDLIEFESQVSGAAWQTAHLASIQSMQSQRLNKLLAKEQPPTLASRDSSGKQSATSGGAGPGARSGMQVLQLDASGAADAEELKKMIMEKLKEQGMEVDKSKLKIKKGAAPEKRK